METLNTDSGKRELASEVTLETLTLTVEKGKQALEVTLETVNAHRGKRETGFGRHP